MTANKILSISLLMLVPPRLTSAQMPLTLPQAVGMALEKNPSLQSAEDERAAARARASRAEAARAPRLDLSQGFSRGNNPVYVFGTLLTERQFTQADFALSALNRPTPLDNFQTRLEGSMLLIDSGSRIERIRSARRMATAADFETEQARQDLILHVVRSYYHVILARESLTAAKEALHTAEANEERIGSLEKAGLVVTSELLSAQVFRAQMKERAIRAENDLQYAHAALNREIGLDPQTQGEPVDALAEPLGSLKSLEEWDQIALTRRPALRAAELARQAAEAERKATRADFGPKIGLYANLERDAETLGGPSGVNWTAGARLDLNLFAGGSDRARLAEAQARERQASHQLEWLRSGIRLEVRKTFLSASAAAQQAAAARDAVEQARESLRIIQNRYQAGLTTITELLRAQAAQLDARAAYLAALHDWLIACAELERASGTLTEDSALVLHSAQGAAQGAAKP